MDEWKSGKAEKKQPERVLTAQEQQHADEARKMRATNNVKPPTKREIEEKLQAFRSKLEKAQADGEIAVIIKGIERSIRGLEAQLLNFNSNTQEVATATEGVMLPSWPNSACASPNILLRTSIFGITRKTKDSHIERPTVDLVVNLTGKEINYKGQKLDQNDFNAWESMIQLVRRDPLGSTCHVTRYKVLDQMGLTDTGPNRTKLSNSLTRLRSGALTIKEGKFTHIIGFLDEATTNEVTGSLIVRINPKAIKLYDEDQFTLRDWSLRHELKKQTAQWLHGYYASHAEPFPVLLKMLREDCGSETKRIDHFRDQIKDSLEDIACAYKKHGLYFDFKIAGGLVYVNKTPSASQKRHLAKVAGTKTRKKAVLSTVGSPG